MGGVVSELRGEIHIHVLIVQHYPMFLEPMLAAVQYFLHTAEIGEGVNCNKLLQEVFMDVAITNKRAFKEASIQVKLLSENAAVTEALLHAVQSYHKLEMSPDIDTFKRWYDPPWCKKKAFPEFGFVPHDEVQHYRIAVLRASVRCLRLMTFCQEGTKRLEECGGLAILNKAVLENPFDEFVKDDVKAILLAVYSGDEAVRRICISNVPTVVEMMKNCQDNAIVQLAGVRRVCSLLANVKARQYSQSQSPPLPAQQLSPCNKLNGPANNEMVDAVEVERLALFAELDAYAVTTLITETLNRFDVDEHLSLYVHVCRFISFVAIEERNAKLVGQTGGIEGSIRLLFKAREMQREKKKAEKVEVNRLSEMTGLFERNKAPRPQPIDASRQTTSLESLAVVDFTPTAIGQQALWALDSLATLDFNVFKMKQHKLKYLLREIRLDPDGKELASTLILTRRIRLIRWDKVADQSTNAFIH